jgi:WhiB family redox-sensing transcriptional regulator
MEHWTHRAACRDADPDLFFPITEDRTRRAIAAQVARAKTVCAGCPVWSTCLSYAVETRQDHGIWGGLTATERRRLARGGTETRTRQQPPDAA